VITPPGWLMPDQPTLSQSALAIRGRPVKLNSETAQPAPRGPLPSAPALAQTRRVVKDPTASSGVTKALENSPRKTH
jgi:hypothetical protein